MNQTQRANNSIRNDSLATMFGKYNYEEGLIDQIYESETNRFTIQGFSSKALISNTFLQDSNSDVKEDNMINKAFLAYLNLEFHDRALLANQNRFYKRLALLTQNIEDVSKQKSEKGKTDARSGKRKDSTSSKDVVFIKAEVSPTESSPVCTSHGESVNDCQEPLPALPKLSGAEPIGSSQDATSTIDLTQTFIVSEKTKHALKIPKPFIPFKYCGFNYHHSSECEYYLRCEICGSIAHEPSDCDKRVIPNDRRPRIASQPSKEPTAKKIENLNEVNVKELRSDNGTEFRNHKVEDFYDEKRISQHFSSPCTPKQNDVAERRTETLIEAVTTMLNEEDLLKSATSMYLDALCSLDKSWKKLFMSPSMKLMKQ
ncbi:retrovirus-related pol polyprotein from transposon TNT 1-94 [Tanacetum coccineum]